MILNLSGAGASSSVSSSAESSADNLQEGLSVFIEYLPEVAREKRCAASCFDVKR